MRMSEKCRNNNSDTPLTSRRTDGGRNRTQAIALKNLEKKQHPKQKHFTTFIYFHLVID